MEVIRCELERVEHTWYCVGIKTMGTEWSYALANNKQKDILDFTSLPLYKTL